MTKTYPKMNAEIVNLLRFTDDNHVTMYAAARIEELEAERDALAAVLHDANELHSEVRDERDVLRKACEAYLKDHNEDIASLCRDAGIQPSVCDCDLCEQARDALEGK